MKKKKRFSKPPCIFKIDISLKTYKLLLRDFRDSVPKEMSYFYFDTDENSEKAEFLNADVRLRLRVKKARYTLELKNKAVYPLREFSQELTLMSLRLIFRGTVPSGIIRQQLLELGLSDRILWVGCTQSTRIKRNFYDGVLVLDKTTHVYQVHYSVEFRSYQSISRHKILLLKRELNIPPSYNLFTSKLKHFWASKI